MMHMYIAGVGAMKLIFRGHDDRYAIEQSLLAFFPEERPVYETAEAGRTTALMSPRRRASAMPPASPAFIIMAKRRGASPALFLRMPPTSTSGSVCVSVP